MPEKYYKIELGDNVIMVVYFVTSSGLIVNFVVKLILLLDETYHEVVRYDNAHNCPHKDVLGTNGKVEKKVWFELLDNKQGLNLAIKDLKDNYQLYVERFRKWLQE